MSSARLTAILVAAVIAAAFGAPFVVGCASGGSAGPNPNPDSSNLHPDAHTPLIDAALHDGPGDASLPDAKVFLDAHSTADAAPGGFCADNTDCHAAGECCLIAVCVPGTAVGTTLCFPN